MTRRTHRSTAVVTAISVWATACAPATDPPSTEGSGPGAQAVSQANDLQTLRQAAEAYQAAATAKDAEAVVGFYADDAIMIPPGADPVEGIEAVRSYRFGFIETPGVELAFELVRAELSGDGSLGWTLAIGDITIHSDEGPPGKDLVRDFHSWRKDAQGDWKIVVDFWNSGVPAG